MEKIKWTANEMPKTEDKYLPLMSKEKIEKALAFHKSFPQYSETPLAELNHMAAYLGLNDFFVKDESYRFGLNAFKVLGGSFAMANYIAEKLKKDVSELTYDELTSDQLRSAFGQATFFTATDGNHGRGGAWAANKLGQKSVVLMPKGSTQTRKENIEKEVLEETGLVVTAKELLAVYDTDKRKDIPQLFQYYKMIFSCEILENHPFEKNIETSNCAYFSLDNLPPLSIKRTTKEQLMALMNQTTGALSD